MRVLKLNIGKIIIYANFPLFLAFQCEASEQLSLHIGHMRSCQLLVWQVDHLDALYHVRTRSL
jgi:hypothetical protein